MACEKGRKKTWNNLKGKRDVFENRYKMKPYFKCIGLRRTQSHCLFLW